MKDFTTLFFCFANDYSEPENDEQDGHLEALKDEENAINRILSPLRNEEICKVITLPNTTKSNFFSTLQDNRKILNIIHFSGHAHQDSIQLEDELGEPHQVSLTEIITIFKSQKDLKFVFLNGCDTVQQADFLVQAGIPCTIGTNRKVGQYISSEFATEFYRSLASGACLQEAFDEAKSYVDSENTIDSPFIIKSKDEKSLQWCPFPTKNVKINDDGKIKVLQLSDLNFSDDGDKQNKALENLKNSLQGKSADLILITGNLIKKGTDVDSIEAIYDKYILDLADTVGVTENNIILCSGLNETEESLYLRSVTKEIHSFRDNDDLAGFRDSKEDFLISKKPLEKFYTFGNKKHESDSNSGVDSLYSTHIRTIGKYKVGIAAINIHWSSFSNGELVFPVEILHEITEKIKGTDFKILLSNTNFNLLKLYNRREIKDYVSKYYDSIFLGSKPQNSGNNVFSTHEGIVLSYSGFNNLSEIDFCYHSYDILNKMVEEKRYIHFKNNEGVFPKKSTKSFSIPSGSDKERQLKLIHTINKWEQRYHEIGDDLFINHHYEGKGFIDIFTSPSIKEKPLEEIQLLQKGGKLSKNYFDKALNSNDNFIVLGKDKSGKSSLLIFIAISLSSRFDEKKTIPIYLNLNDKKYTRDNTDLLTLISRHLECSKKFAKTLTNKYNFKLLIDNFDPANNLTLEKVATFINNHKCSYIICSDQTTVRAYENFDFGFNHYEKVFIHPVTRIEIRSLVKKSTNKSDAQVDEIVEKIVEVFKQHKMTSNFWTVSVFLWIMSKTGNKDFTFQNNSQLIELYIQELLDQRELAHQENNRFSYPKYKQYLSYLAYRLLKDHELSTHSASYTDILKITSDFLNRSRRNVATPESVVKYIIDKGVLKKASEKTYTFRLNGVFEYFLANEMFENEIFLKEILDDDSKYLSFKNELDLYSGFKGRDKKANEQFLRIIWAKTQIAFEGVNNNYSRVETDTTLSNLVKDSKPLTLIGNLPVQSVEPLSYEEKDKFQNSIEVMQRMENEEDFSTEVKFKKPFDKEADELEALEINLFIMARVYRNIEVEDTNDEQIDEQIFSFILDSSCNYGFKLLEGMTEKMMSEKDDDDSNDDFFIPKALLKIMTSFVPVIVQETLHESLGHITLENIIKSKIKELEVNADANQFKLFVLYFCLVDLDLSRNRIYIEKAIAISKLNSLKFSIAIKLLYYLIFKSYDKKELRIFLKEKFRKLQLKINPKIGLDDLNRTISNIDKTSLIAKNMEG